MNPPLPPDETERLQALRRYGVLDTPPEAAFDRITRLAARLLRAPIAVVSLSDAERQWFKSRHGLDARESPRADAFCAHAILDNQIMVVPDATTDPRFADNPLVTGPTHIRFYAGAPIVTPDGFRVGTLCVLDRTPRTLTDAEKNLLADLAVFVMDEMELRLAAVRLREEAAERERLEGLAASEERFRALAECLGEAVLMTDPDDVVLYANARIADLAGWTREEMIGRPAYELLLPPEEWPILRARNERRIRGIAERYEAPILHKNGGVWWASIDATPLRDAAGNIVGTLAAITDVTERKRAEERLAESENKYRLLADAMDDVVSLHDPDGSVLYVSPSITKLTGCAPEESLGMDVYDMIHPEDRERVRERVHQLVSQGKPASVEWRHPRPDGACLWMETRINVVYDEQGRLHRIAAISRDITERRRAEEEKARLDAEIEDQRRRLDALIASVPGVVFELSFPPAGNAGGIPRCTFVSDYIEEALGYTPAEWLAAPESWLSAVLPEDRERVLGDLARAIREGVVGMPTFRWIARDGRVLRGEMYTTAIRDAATGAPIGLRGVALDVTERHEAQERLAESEAKYRLIADAMDDMVSLHDPDGRFLYASPSSVRLTGHAPEELVGTDPYETTHPEDRQRVREESHRHVLQGRPASVEWRRRRRDGSYVWLETKTSAVYDEQGRLYRMAALSRDITERKRVEEALDYRLRLEALITGLSTDFISRPLPAIDQGIAAALAAIGTFTDVDRAYVFRLEDAGRTASCTHEWCAPGVTPQKRNLQRIGAESLPWVSERLRRFEVVHVPRVADLPPEMSAEREHWEAQDIRSLVLVPMVLGDTLVGFVGLDSVRAEKAWSDEIIALLRVVGSIFASALERRRAEEALREKVSRLQVLQLLHDELQGVLDLPTVLERIGAIVPRHLGADRASVRLLPLPPDAPECPARDACLREARPVVIEDCAHTDLLSRACVERLGLQSLIVLPILRDSTPIGALRLDYTERAHSPAPGEMEFLALVTEQLAIVIQNAQLFTERERALNALREAEEKYRSIFENATEGIFQSTPDGRLVSANPALARISGYDSPEEMIRSLENVGQEIYADPARRREFARLLREEGRVTGFETQARRKDGTLIWVSQNARAVRDPQSGELLYFEGTFEDITARKAAEEQLIHDALHDRLTGLPNRTLFLDRLAHQLERQRRRENCCSAVLFVDFDGFKVVNDSLGHGVGDEILIAAARRLQAILRPGDTLARLGGDEFAILLEDVADVGDAVQAAERIQSELRPPFDIRGEAVFFSASIGIALASPDYEQPEDLLRDADAAMYQAKEQGRARYAVFDRGMHARAVTRLRMESDLRRALERGELRVFYQPIVSLRTGRTSGVEALARWRHPTRGPVSPAEFIPLAEEIGVIVSLGQWLLGEACRQIRAWDDALFLSVNISSRQFSHAGAAGAGLPHTIDEALAEADLEARRLHLEITESVLLENEEAVAAQIAELRARGVHFAMDDFGTGYSSLSYLHRFPITLLKIDRSFIRHLEERDEDRAIVEAILKMSHSLNIAVVAEGIETAGQLALLRAMGCDYGQGYLFSPPLAPADVEALLAPGPRW